MLDSMSTAILWFLCDCDLVSKDLVKLKMDRITNAVLCTGREGGVDANQGSFRDAVMAAIRVDAHFTLATSAVVDHAFMIV